MFVLSQAPPDFGCEKRVRGPRIPSPVVVLIQVVVHVSPDPNLSRITVDKFPIQRVATKKLVPIMYILPRYHADQTREDAGITRTDAD